MIENDIQQQILRKMTPAQKLRLSMRLYYSAWELKSAWLRFLHKNWTEQQINQEVKRIFTHAGS